MYAGQVYSGIIAGLAAQLVAGSVAGSINGIIRVADCAGALRAVFAVLII